jgi:ATP synthase protein I
MRDSPFSREVGAQETRKLRARRQIFKTVWFGFGTFGLVGWSVAVPTLLGALLGMKLDEKHFGSHSWTLNLILIGLAIGILNAWHWVLKEGREIEEGNS